MNDNITLFDMDGTLTKSRQPFDRLLEPALSKLSEVSDIGIVSGSDFEYIMEQMEFVLNRSSLRYRTILLPCNGTKYYTPPENSDDNFSLQHEVDMVKEMSDESFNELMCLMISEQAKHCAQLPSLSGHYVDYRGSMINWCPIGRNANQKQREAFIQWDTTFNFRSVELIRLTNLQFVKDNNLEIKLGGDTSFDIFPKGWDKTYCLQHLKNYNNILFVGDRCGSGGNDKELYDFLGPKKAFVTSGPTETKQIIEKNIIPLLKESA